MNGVNINIDWEVLGAELTRLSSNEQNAFFRGFASEMLRSSPHIAIERQMLAVKCGDCNGERPITKLEGEVFSYLCYEGE